MRECLRSMGIIVAVLAGTAISGACTSVVVSGRVTPDGRPYIFKNRDTGNQDNLVVSIQGCQFRFIGIVETRDTMAQSVWSGHNEAGFAIANTAAYNLNGRHEPGKPRPQGDEFDGILMRHALETCGSLSDLEHLLDSLRDHKALRSNSNFAALDAYGNAAYYETGNRGYVKFDANDPLQAPFGYLVRTNHGMSGERSMDQGVERYLAISDYMARAYTEGDLGFEHVIRQVTRRLTHGLTRQNLWDYAPETDDEPVYFPFRDFIPRYMTASAQLIQGVKAGEDPLLTVAWTIIGSPLTTVAIPLWLTPSGELPAVVTRHDGGTPMLVEAGLILKKLLFPLERGNGHDYINVARLINHGGTGILQQVGPIEDEIFRRARPVLEALRRNGQTDKDIHDFYQWVDQYLGQQYLSRFGIVL